MRWRREKEKSVRLVWFGIEKCEEGEKSEEKSKFSARKKGEVENFCDPSIVTQKGREKFRAREKIFPVPKVVSGGLSSPRKSSYISNPPSLRGTPLKVKRRSSRERRKALIARKRIKKK